jgi:hypothetical protein
MSWVGQVERMGDVKNSYKLLVTTTEEKRALGRLRRRWEYNI